MPIIAERYGASLRDYGGDGPIALFVPSLINPPNVLDLDEQRSLLRWIAARGHRVLLLDWGIDVAARRDLSVGGHVEQILLPFIATLDRPPALVGYCLGGTMAAAGAPLASVRSVATIAAPWRFAAFPDEARSSLARLWEQSRATATALGALPMEVVQSAFWGLDPTRTIAKFEGFAEMDPASEQARTFVTLEDWANDGPPLPLAAARELFEDLFRDDLPGSGEWIVGASAIDPTRLQMPLLNFLSTTDRIVPHASALPAGERMELDRGHVGMVVGSRAKDLLWEPLEAWLSSARSS